MPNQIMEIQDKAVKIKENFFLIILHEEHLLRRFDFFRQSQHFMGVLSIFCPLYYIIKNRL